MTDALKRLQHARAHDDKVRGRVVVLTDGTILSEREYMHEKKRAIMNMFMWGNTYAKEKRTKTVPDVKPKRTKKDRH